MGQEDSVKGAPMGQQASGITTPKGDPHLMEADCGTR